MLWSDTDEEELRWLASWRHLDRQALLAGDTDEKKLCWPARRLQVK